MDVLRTETHIINKKHKLFSYCDEMCFKSKNLYNYTNYIIRQEFIKNKIYISAFDLNKLLKTHESFQALPAKTAQQIIIQLSRNWKSYFKSIKDWKNNKYKYTGMPKLPSYKKKDGRNIIFFDYMQGKFREGKYYFQYKKGENRDEYIETLVTKENFRLLRIVPYGSVYKIEIVYRKQINISNNNDNYLAIDLGVNNLATLTNNIGTTPIIINGRILKSMNNYYNKIRSKALSYIGKGASKRLKRIDLKYKNKVDNTLHQVSRWIINYCIFSNIGNIIIGRNKDWQRNSSLGRKNNQTFVQIPFEKLIDKIKYKAEDVGISVWIVNEMYTSKASFIDLDFLPDNFGEYQFSGKRINRGLYQSKNNTLINADVNGSYNILRKCNPEFAYDRIKGVSLHPVKVEIA